MSDVSVEPKGVDYKQVEDDVQNLLHLLQIRTHGLRQWQGDFQAAFDKVHAHWATMKGFPLYMMMTGDKLENATLLPIRQAGVLFDDGFQKVDTGKYVLEADMTIRPMTKEEERRISEIADEHSARK